MVICIGEICQADSIGSKFFDCAFFRCQRVRDIAENRKSLREKVEELQAKLKEVKEKCWEETTLTKNKDKSPSVRSWISSARLCLEDAKEVMNQAEHLPRKSKPKSSYNVSKDIVARITQIDGLLGKVENLHPWVVDSYGVRMETPVWPVEIPPNLAKLYEDSYCLGIIGPRGSGKSSILKTIHNELFKCGLAQDIIFFDIAGMETLTIQQKIAVKLKPILDGKSVCERDIEELSTDALQQIIFDRLNGRRFVISLDNVPPNLILSEIGIPKPPQQDVKVHIVFTSTHAGVVGNNLANIYHLQPLENDKASDLFNNILAERRFDHDSEMIDSLCKSCMGLPKPITDLARHLNLKQFGVWPEVLCRVNECIALEQGELEDPINLRTLSILKAISQVESGLGGPRRKERGSADMETCAQCGKGGTTKRCLCDSVSYCSQECQDAHWKSGHKSKCNGQAKVLLPNEALRAQGVGERKTVHLAPQEITTTQQFIKLYAWDGESFEPRGLVNCGNSCYVNVVLQCLLSTRPLVAYVSVNDHKKECNGMQNGWCFLCAFQTLVEAARNGCSSPYRPNEILSHLTDIGVNFSERKQEDAHEFLRFAISKMQSACLNEFGREKVVNPASGETTIIDHVFGGLLQSQVECKKCSKVSKKLENIMDLTIEIHESATSLKYCLDQFTREEPLEGLNMYRCDSCKQHVKAVKRLTIQQAPNILTIVLKRFQTSSGRSSVKLNKKITFPRSLNLNPYKSEKENWTDIYILYGVIVHVNMKNSPSCGHYICYVKDFNGNWNKVDDTEVKSVKLSEVLSQTAYILLYGRKSARAKNY